MKIDYTLYLCTDRSLMSTPTLESAVEAAIHGGATVVQLREKDCTSWEFLSTALQLRGITRRAGVPLLINDRADIALACDADGVHVGQSDLPCAVVRKMLPAGKLVGVSARTVTEAAAAERDGADYLGVGAMYPTGTKADAAHVTMEELRRIRDTVKIPIVVIGGINEKTIPDFYGMGINGLAVVSALIAQPDITAAARRLRKAALAL